MKQIKTLRNFYVEAMEELCEKMVGQLLHGRSYYFEPVLIVKLGYRQSSEYKIIATLLYNEEIVYNSYKDWRDFQKSFFTTDEYERYQEGIKRVEI